MRSGAPRMLLPVLGKELVELAARRRTYVVRVCYAAALSVCFLIYLLQMLGDGGLSIFTAAGRGRDMFQLLVVAQFVGIFALLPGIMAGAVTQEKERDSMGVLLVTRLTPREIVVQKYVGRMVPMLTILLLSLPFLAIAYSLGGITPAYLFSGAALLLLTCLQVGALCLAVSSFCATTSQASVASYTIVALLYGILIWFLSLAPASTSNVLRVRTAIGGVLIAPLAFGHAARAPLVVTAVHSFFALPLTIVFLVLARVFLVRRAFVKPRSGLRRVFERMDVFWHEANKLIGGIVLVPDRRGLPGKRPVAWREIHTKSLGKASHLARVACFLGIPLVVIVIGVVLGGGVAVRDGQVQALPQLLTCFWLLSIFALALPAAGTFASERARRTLDVLLVTPMSGRQIILQKARAHRRVAAVLGGAILAAVSIEAWVEPGGSKFVYLLASALAVLTYLPMFTWLALWIGLRVRTPARATIGTLAVILAWCFGPLILLWLVAPSAPLSVAEPTFYAFLVSPLSMIAFAEAGTVGARLDAAPIIAIVLNYGFYGAVLLRLRHACLARADALLGRVPEPGASRRQRWSTRARGGSG